MSTFWTAEAERRFLDIDLVQKTDNLNAMRFAKLQDWQSANGKDDAEMAGLLDCSRQTVQRLHKGESMPRRPTLARLKQLTGISAAECQEHLETIADARAPSLLRAHAEAGAA